MLLRGNSLQPHLIAMQSNALNYFAVWPEQLKFSFLPYALVSAPLLIVSVVTPLLTPIALFATLYVLYAISKRYDKVLFTIEQPISHLAYMMPFAGFSSFWGVMLHLINHQYMMPFLAFYTLLLWVVIRPVFLKWTRYVSFDFSFKLFSALALIASIGGNYYG